MKYKIFLLLFTLLAFANSIVAQNTGLFTYTGGYFIKDGNNWYEYRPGDKVGVWASYTQYGEEENFYNIENNINYVSVPKDPSNSFLLLKRMESGNLSTQRVIFTVFLQMKGEIFTAITEATL